MAAGIGQYTSVDKAIQPDNFVKMMVDLPALAPEVDHMRQLMFSWLEKRKPKMLLDAGCGPGVTTREMSMRLASADTVVGVDASERMLDYARTHNGMPNVEYQCGDITNLAFKDNQFDAIRVERVLHHVSDPQKAVSELARVLKPNGYLIAAESDTYSARLHPLDEPINTAFNNVFNSGFQSRAVGRYLHEYAADAGLMVLEHMSFSLIFHELEAIEDNFDIRDILKQAAHEQEYERVMDQLESANRDHRFFFSIPVYLVLASKP